jgi:hypothetical protein
MGKIDDPSYYQFENPWEDSEATAEFGYTTVSNRLLYYYRANIVKKELR